MAVDYRPDIEPSDVRPSMGTYNSPKTFRFWCQKVLPLVYDDSLSYYELLCKVVDYLNKTMEDVNTAVEDVTNLNSAFGSLENHVNASETALLQAYTDLQTYVNDYFDNLDVQEEINNKLDAMVADGTLDTILLPYFNEYVEDANAQINSFKQDVTQIVNNEIATRTSMDASLEASIATESATRAAQDTILQNQISQLISPSGEAPSAAEVTDARIGADGVTYSTLGEAIRTNDLTTLNALNLNLSTSDFILGSSNSSTGDYLASSSRIVSTIIYRVNKNTRFYTDAGYNVALDVFDEAFTHVLNSSWQRNYYMPIDGYVRILMRYNTDATITNIEDLLPHLHISANKVINYNGWNKLITDHFISGTTSTTNGRITANNTRIVTENMIKVKKGTTIGTIPFSNNVAITKYNLSGTFIAANPYAYKWTADEDCYVRIVAKKFNNSVIDTTEIPAIIDKIYFNYPASDVDENLSDKVTPTFILGSTNSSNGKITSSTTRIVTRRMIKCGKGSIISSLNDYINIACDIFDEFGNHISNTGWKQIVNIDYDGYVRVIAKYFDDRTITTVSNVSNYVLILSADFTSSYDLKSTKKCVADVAHKGYDCYYGENTKGAYVDAKLMGFDYGETDIQWTSDNVPVCLHDETIDRTSNGTGNIHEMTYADVSTYDFGHDSILRFTDYLALLKRIGLTPVIELKELTTYTMPNEAYGQLVDYVKRYYGDKVIWASNSLGLLLKIKAYDANATLMWFMYRSTIESQTEAINEFITEAGTNPIIGSIPFNYLLSGTYELFKTNNIPLHVFDIESFANIASLDPYVSGVLCGNFVPSMVMLKNSISA